MSCTENHRALAKRQRHGIDIFAVFRAPSGKQRAILVDQRGGRAVQLQDQRRGLLLLAAAHDLLRQVVPFLVRAGNELKQRRHVAAADHADVLRAVFMQLERM